MEEGVSMLKKTLKGLHHEEKGATLIVVALCLLVVFGLAAISADAGMLYKTRRDMVAAADACALAVAQEMADIMTESNGTIHLTDTEAQTLGENYKGRADSVTIELITLDNGEEAVKASVIRNEDYFFGKLIGNRDNSNVVATAIATWGYPTAIAGGNIIPSYVEVQDYNYHLTDPDYNMYLHDNNNLPNSHWGLFNIYDNSNDIKNGLRGGFDLTLKQTLVVDVPINKGTAPGNKLNYTKDGIGESEMDIERNGRIVRAEAGLTTMEGLVPIVQNITSPGMETVTIIGFAYYKIIDCVQNKDGYGVDGGGPYLQPDGTPYPVGTVIGEFTTGITDVKVIDGDQNASHNFGSYYVELIV
ncbi:pilus assembly protein TadG-related protein [Pelotomaculum propionicicum]|uniref:pilus assembly protein TadG-related protein n=1 Tax=Pelotomaculum propionicicum TaxID=258475 RepID=UPI003B80C1F0